MPRTRSRPRGAAGAATPQDPMRHLGLVYQLALRFHSSYRSIATEDFFAADALGLCEAARRFNPARGTAAPAPPSRGRPRDAERAEVPTDGERSGRGPRVPGLAG